MYQIILSIPDNLLNTYNLLSSVSVIVEEICILKAIRDNGIWFMRYLSILDVFTITNRLCLL